MHFQVYTLNRQIHDEICGLLSVTLRNFKHISHIQYIHVKTLFYLSRVNSILWGVSNLTALNFMNMLNR
jgi:hypothetical protein